MKKLLLSALLISSLAGSAQILSEGFESDEFPPEGWTASSTNLFRPWNLVTNVFSAPYQSNFIISGTNSASINYIAGDNVAELTSKEFSLQGATDATLSFKARLSYTYMVNPNNSGNLQAQISTNGTSWTTLWVEEDQGVFVNFETLNISLNLQPYLNQSNLKIRFVYTANDADGLSIDDILVSATLGVNDMITSKFAVYPNPTNNFITVSNSENIILKTAAITDIRGRMIQEINFDNVSTAQINVSDLTSGIYFITIKTDSGSAVKKFIKN